MTAANKNDDKGALIMFNISNDYGNIPYDGFRIYSLRRPHKQFIEHARQLHAITKRPSWLFEGTQGWQNFVSLPVNGTPGALQVGWGPLRIGRNMPKMTIRCNPSTAGLNPTEVLTLIRWVLTWPEGEPVAELATKIDFEGPQRQIDAHLYLPGARTKNQQYPGETHYHGSRKGNQLKVYDKGLESGGSPAQVARVEITEHFKNNANPKQNLRRPTLEELLRGDLVNRNGLRRVKVVDLAAVANRELTALALETGLTEAIRKGLPARENAPARLLYPSMAVVRRLVNAHATEGGLFNLYKDQALAWHSQYDPAVADRLTVTWSDQLGLEVVNRTHPMQAA